MKKTTRRTCLLSGLLLAGALTLTGCGEEIYELEDNEREIIVNYAAHIIAKYNVKQPEGYRYVYVPEEDVLLEEETQPEEEAAEESAESEMPDETDASGGDIPDDGADASAETSVTLSEALGLDGISAVYTGAELTDTYNSVVPESGKQLLILHVTLQNQTAQKTDCDILSLLPTFRAKVNGTEETTAELTILTENLSTWEEPIEAGESVDTIILFQLSDSIQSVEQLEMRVSVGENTSRVVFL